METVSWDIRGRCYDQNLRKGTTQGSHATTVVEQIQQCEKMPPLQDRGYATQFEKLVSSVEGAWGKYLL
jgi:hypothetical protein